MSLTISYIGLLHTQLVGRVRTHGQQYLRARWVVLLPGLMLQVLCRLGLPCPITENSSKEEIISCLHQVFRQ